MVTAHGVSHPGRVRKTNEDAWRAEPGVGLFLVADGMGGHNAGEVASAMAAEVVAGFMERTQAGEEVTWPYGIDPALSFDANRVMTSIKVANRRVFKAAESRDDYQGMGTTVTAALVNGSSLIFGSVGDSRLYSFAGGQLTQLTSDDSWVNKLKRENPGVPVPATHPMRHVLTSVVGAWETIELTVTTRSLVPGETLLITSDGVHGDLDDAFIAAILGRETGAAEKAEALVRAVLEGEARDNATAVVICYEGPEPATVAHEPQPTRIRG